MNRLGERYQDGAAMIEFALGLIVFLTLIAVFIDLGVGMFHRNLINEAVVDSSREVAMDFGRKMVPKACDDLLTAIDGARCGDLEQCVVLAAEKRIEKSAPRLLHRVAFQAALDPLIVPGVPPPPPGDPAYYVLRSGGSYAAWCSFCGFFPALHYRMGSQIRLQTAIACTQS